jgi:hypothetical protein
VETQLLGILDNMIFSCSMYLQALIGILGPNTTELVSLPMVTNFPLFAALEVAGVCYKIQHLAPKMHLSVLLLQKELLPGKQRINVKLIFLKCTCNDAFLALAALRRKCGSCGNSS